MIRYESVPRSDFLRFVHEMGISNSSMSGEAQRFVPHWKGVRKVLGSRRSRAHLRVVRSADIRSNDGSAGSGGW
eukprot:6189984-Pleurochrysis_carterae.AAC.1